MSRFSFDGRHVNMKQKVWINWESHRRSSELSKALGFQYYCFEYNGLYRYPLSIYKTCLKLIKHRPSVLAIQNPSMILACFACLYKKIFKTFLIVDRHTTFRLNKPKSGNLRIWIFMKLHYLTLKNADLTIVTNEYLSILVNKNGGKAFVLPDKLPTFRQPRILELSEKSTNILMISSFGKDEPLLEVFKAMSQLEGTSDVRLYVSGNYKKVEDYILKQRPQNVTFTGYLSDQDYIDLLFSVDGVIALTTSDYCMLCGCYEAVSAEKPLITSHTEVLIKYFYNAIHVKNDAKSISNAIIEIDNKLSEYANNTKKMKESIETTWARHFKKLIDIVENQLT